MARKAADKTVELQIRLENQGAISIGFDDTDELRKIEMTLTRWAEGKCGDSGDFASWAIERDETTGKPYRCVYPHDGQMRREPIADRERGALNRAKVICDRHGLHMFHQGDCRGAALYVSRRPIDDQTYSRYGVSCCVMD